MEGVKPALRLILAVAASLTVLAALCGASASAATAPITWGADQGLDTASPYGANGSFTAVSCATTNLCVGAGYNGHVVATTDPTSGAPWTDEGVAWPLDTAACAPNTTFCMVAGGFVHQPVVKSLSSNDANTPLAGWQTSSLGGTHWIGELQCPVAGVCYGFRSGNRRFVSYLNSAWQTTNLSVTGAANVPRAVVSLSCPSADLCVAVTANGQALISTDPSDPSAGAWTTTSLNLATAVSVSCSGTSYCAATDAAGDVSISTDPTDGSASQWAMTTATFTPVLQKRTVNTISCQDVVGGQNASDSYCLALASRPNGTANVPVYWSTGGAAGPYSGEDLPAAADDPILYGVSGQNDTRLACVSSELCVATSGSGYADTTTDPTDGSNASWTAPTEVVPGDNAITFGAHACGSSTSCVGIDVGNCDALDCTGPTSGRFFSGAPDALTESSAGALTDSMPDVTCASANVCIGLDQPINGEGTTTVGYTTDAAGGARTWVAASTLPGASAWAQPQCPSAQLCITTLGDQVAFTTDPGSSASWKVTTLTHNASIGNGLTCVTATECFGPLPHNRWLSTSDPTGGASAWHVTHSTKSFRDWYVFQNTVCPTTGECLAAGEDSLEDNALAVSTNPMVGSSWKIMSPRDDMSPDNPANLVCPSAGACLFTVNEDGINNALIAVINPTSKHPSWRRRTVPGASFYNLSCTTSGVCAAVSNGWVWESSDPSLLSSWTRTEPSMFGVSALSCQQNVCLASSRTGTVVAGIPTGS